MPRQLFAWSGAVIFAVALGFFLYTYMVTFAVETAGSASRTAVTWNIALFTAFALHHSVFARAPVRAWVGRHVPAGLERSVYVWVASLMLMAVCVLWLPVGGIVWVATGAMRAALWGLQAIGIWLTLHGASVIDVFELSGTSQASAESKRDTARPTQFKTSGPYGWMRHPIYSGWFLLVFAVSPMTMTRMIFALVSCLYLLVAIPLEERSLRLSSAGAYDEYMQKVRWKLLPGIFSLGLLAGW